MQRIAEIWKEDRHVLEDNAFELTEHLRMADENLRQDKEELKLDLLQRFAADRKAAFDPAWGAFCAAIAKVQAATKLISKTMRA